MCFLAPVFHIIFCAPRCLWWCQVKPHNFISWNLHRSPLAVQSGISRAPKRPQCGTVLSLNIPQSYNSKRFLSIFAVVQGEKESTGSGSRGEGEHWNTKRKKKLQRKFEAWEREWTNETMQSTMTVNGFLIIGEHVPHLELCSSLVLVLAEASE